jgi:hypothetical protein
MIKSIKTLIFCLLGMPAALFSQQLSNQVLVPCAGLSASQSVNYTQTVGETAIEIIGCSDFVLTQGYQQPLFKGKPDDDDWPDGMGTNVYPNPASDFITVEIWGESAETFRIDIINITGNIVLSEKRVFNERFWSKDPLKIENLIRGFYLVRIYNDKGILNRIFKIEKL